MTKGSRHRKEEKEAQEGGLDRGGHKAGGKEGRQRQGARRPLQSPAYV